MREENEPNTFKDSLPENPLKDETEKTNKPFWNRKGRRYLVQHRFEKTPMGWLMTPRQLVRGQIIEHTQKLYSR